MKTGIELIAQERQEQIEKHGHTTDLDIKINCHGELHTAARALLSGDDRKRVTKMPISWDDESCFRMARKDYKERLIIAGALIAAEIDRIESINTF